ncbi:AraC family transcriptional regulator [Reichenbachiella ulvae]|uniref:AraC family transcriptional regulator n=1 Tax=Reichenbachiella ulvae TaxID=2980104 RepID=A0ABT3CNW2_9BACT|nr:AraC family transcriptional regulator [Reichenbachiella ulvae]MCV9385307.1 AraC family transcriptional regulator [Reichenbachiella ulvae]
MDKHKQYYPLTLLDRHYDRWIEPEHSHNYYQIIYIKKGKGIHVLNDIEISYSTGSVFLLNPKDHHHFEVFESTHFVGVSFTESFIKDCMGIPEVLSKKLKYGLENEEYHNVRLQFKNSNKKAIESIFRTILSSEGNDQIVYFQILSMLEIIKQNYSSKKEVHALHIESSKMEKVLSYIHNNITHPKLLQIDLLAEKFGISKNYVSNYFKRNMHITLRKYIDNYRMGLMQNRLIHSHFTIKEIAHDFGFTDESHLNKFFKKYWNMSAKAYRQMEKKEEVL